MFFLMKKESRISLYFFFSSRRRHTRSKRDWSSDVCSSDLPDEGDRTVLDRIPQPCLRCEVRGIHLGEVGPVKGDRRQDGVHQRAERAAARLEFQSAPQGFQRLQRLMVDELR